MKGFCHHGMDKVRQNSTAFPQSDKLGYHIYNLCGIQYPVYGGLVYHCECEDTKKTSPRAVSYTHLDVYKRQVQERMTLQIKECIQETLNPLGVMVVVEAKHMCMPVSYTHLDVYKRQVLSVEITA